MKIGEVWKMLKNRDDQKKDVRDEHHLLRQAKPNRTTPLKDITAQFNDGRQVPESERLIQRFLSKCKYHRRVCRKKIRIRERNRMSIKLFWDKTIEFIFGERQEKNGYQRV